MEPSDQGPNQQGTKHTTTADRTRIRTLILEANWTKKRVETLGYSRNQIRLALRSLEPQRGRGRKGKLSEAEQAELIEYITSSKAGRRASFLALSQTLFNGQHGEFTIRSTLRRLGYTRHIAIRKPVITEKTRRIRLAFALEHRDWTPEQWKNILWSDETWATGGDHRRIYVTRRDGEALDPTCVMSRIQRKKGWMFWGSFSGYRKGPGLFWEKDWGSINSLGYQEHTLPAVITELQALWPQQVWFMQDNAPSHGSKSTKEFLTNHHIRFIQWPPNSPDLNPIEPVWCWIKDYIQQHFWEEPNPSYDRLRIIVNEAWEAVPWSVFEALLASMPARMEAVIEAQGMFTKF